MSDNVVIEPATEADLDELSDLLGELFSEESDFRPNKEKQLRGLRLIFEQPNRGRVFVLRRDHSIVGMINLLSTITVVPVIAAVTADELIFAPPAPFGTRSSIAPSCRFRLRVPSEKLKSVLAPSRARV